MAKILIVDDDHGLVDMIQIGLEAMGFHTLTAYDGLAAMEVTQRNNPDVILLDVNLPYKDGFEVCREIRSMTLSTYIPIIMITARDDLQSKIEGLDIGADDYVTKPLDIKEVAARIKSTLRVKGLQDELRFARDELQEMAIKDYLTGCYNRRYIMEILQHEVKKARRYHTNFACLMADIDNFKHINDTYGHPFGDTVLQHVATIFADHLRDSDVVGRYGGEEFIALLPNISQTDELAVICERIRAAVEKQIAQSPQRSCTVTISIGGAVFMGADELAVDTIISDIDAALYQAKHAGKNCFVLKS